EPRAPPTSQCGVVPSNRSSTRAPSATRPITVDRPSAAGKDQVGGSATTIGGSGGGPGRVNRSHTRRTSASGGAGSSSTSALRPPPRGAPAAVPPGVRGAGTAGSGALNAPPGGSPTRAYAGRTCTTVAPGRRAAVAGAPAT